MGSKWAQPPIFFVSRTHEVFASQLSILKKRKKRIHRGEKIENYKARCPAMSQIKRKEKK